MTELQIPENKWLRFRYRGTRGSVSVTVKYMVEVQVHKMLGWGSGTAKISGWIPDTVKYLVQVQVPKMLSCSTGTRKFLTEFQVQRNSRQSFWYREICGWGSGARHTWLRCRCRPIRSWGLDVAQFSFVVLDYNTRSLQSTAATL